MKKFKANNKFTLTARVGLLIALLALQTHACGFKLRSDDYALINGGSFIGIDSITTEVFIPGEEEVLRHHLERTINKKKGIRVASDSDKPDISLELTIKSYHESVVDETLLRNTYAVQGQITVAVKTIDAKKIPAKTTAFSVQSKHKTNITSETITIIEKDAFIQTLMENASALIVEKITVR